MKDKCPCCRCYTLDSGTKGKYEICPVCFWENDLNQLVNPNSLGGSNKVTLNQARDNYIKYGACEASMVKYVRKPCDNERIDT